MLNHLTLEKQRAYVCVFLTRALNKCQNIFATEKFDNKKFSFFCALFSLFSLRWIHWSNALSYLLVFLVVQLIFHHFQGKFCTYSMNFPMFICTLLLFRFLSVTNVVCDSKTNIISRKLGIPERPKKPLTGYYRFLRDVRPSIQKTVSSPREVQTVAAAQWKKLDENQKQKYNQEFEQEKVLR